MTRKRSWVGALLLELLWLGVAMLCVPLGGVWSSVPRRRSWALLLSGIVSCRVQMPRVQRRLQVPSSSCHPLLSLCVQSGACACSRPSPWSMPQTWQKMTWPPPQTTSTCRSVQLAVVDKTDISIRHPPRCQGAAGGSHPLQLADCCGLHTWREGWLGTLLGNCQQAQAFASVQHLPPTHSPALHGPLCFLSVQQLQAKAAEEGSGVVVVSAQVRSVHCCLGTQRLVQACTNSLQQGAWLKLQTLPCVCACGWRRSRTGWTRRKPHCTQPPGLVVADRPLLLYPAEHSSLLNRWRRS